jgi:hypothetical protein
MPHSPAPPAEASAPPGPAEAPNARLGGLWYAAALLGTFVFATVPPLGDPDLPMHLSVGEWVVRHGALPTLEPFAWTRAGAPYFAYSWLAQALYFVSLKAAGPVGLHLVQGAVATAGVCAVWWMARTAGWGQWPSVALAWLHIMVLPTIALDLRPHGFLFVAVPLAWVAALRLSRAIGPGPGTDSGTSDAQPRWPYMLLWAAAALAANTHLLAPMVAAPLALLVPQARKRPAVLAAAAAVVALGLVSTPYATQWPGILRLNFAENALFRYPSPIAEHTPGMIWVARKGLSAWPLIVGALVAVVWVRRDAVRPWGVWADRLLVAAWAGGFLMFALSIRGVTLWWLLALPLFGAALERARAVVTLPALRPVRAALLGTPWLLAAATVPGLIAAAPAEGTVTRRVLPSLGAGPALALADTLDRAAPGRGGRVVTTFRYGSALMWRLPRYSMSIDGRTIFPDSAALMDAFTVGHRSAQIPTVIGSADAAIVPLGSRTDLLLTTVPGWRRLAAWRRASPRRSAIRPRCGLGTSGCGALLVPRPATAVASCPDGLIVPRPTATSLSPQAAAPALPPRFPPPCSPPSTPRPCARPRSPPDVSP